MTIRGRGIRNSLLTRFLPRPLALGALLLLSAVLLASASRQINNNNNDQDKDKNSPREKPYALIFGTVWDPDGRPLYGVKVKIRRADEKKNRWELYSNHTGEFAQRVPPGKGDYVVSADMKDYKLSSGQKFKPGSEVTVHVDKDERVDIGLHLDWLPK